MALPAALQPNGARPTAHGIEVRLTPGSLPGFELELWRAPDDGSGAPNAGAAVQINRLPPIPAAGTSYVDLLAADDAFRHYRWRHVGDGYDVGAYTGWARGKPTILPARFAQGGLITVYPIMRAEPLTDGKFAVVAADAAGVKVDRPVGIDGAVRTLYNALTWLLPNGEFEVWQSASQPHGWTVDTGDSSVAAQDTSVVFSGDAAAKFSFGAGGIAATWRGLATNDPTKGAQCIPLRPGFRYRIIAASRVSTLTGAPKYRLRFQYDAGGTLTDEKQITYRAATTYQRDEFVITVPTAADPNTKFWVEFQRNDTNAKDFWIDSVRFEEEVASLAEQAALLASQGTSFSLNGGFEDGTAYWRVSSASGGANTFEAVTASPIEEAKSGKLTIGSTGTTSRVQQCDRSSDLANSTGGNPLYVPVNPLDEIWASCKVKIGLLSTAFLVTIEEYNEAKSFIQRTTLLTKTNMGAVATFTVYGGAVLSATTRYVVLSFEYPGSVTDNAGTLLVDALSIFWNAARRRCLAYKSAAVQSLTSGAETAITFDAEAYDIGTLHDNATNTTRVTVLAEMVGGGGIRLVGQASFAANVTGSRRLRWKKNNTTFLAETRAAAFATDATVVQCVARDDRPASGDYYELLATQNSGGALNVLNGTREVTFAEAIHDY